MINNCRLLHCHYLSIAISRPAPILYWYVVSENTRSPHKFECHRTALVEAFSVYNNQTNKQTKMENPYMWDREGSISIYKNHTLFRIFLGRLLLKLFVFGRFIGHLIIQLTPLIVGGLSWKVKKSIINFIDTTQSDSSVHTHKCPEDTAFALNIRPRQCDSLSYRIYYPANMVFHCRLDPTTSIALVPSRIVRRP